MKKFLLCVGLIILSFTLLAQQDYLRKANREIVRGDYVSAERQLNAHKALLDSKKTNKNSDEYINVEKKLNRIKRCIGLKQTAVTSMRGYTLEFCDSLVSSAADSEEAKETISTICNELLRAQGCCSEIRTYFPEDTLARNMGNQCQSMLDFLSNIDVEELEIWRSVCEEDTPDSYASFISLYPKSVRSQFAKDRIREFEDNDMWRVYMDFPTYENCKAYLEAFPEGLHLEQAQNDFVILEENWYWESATNRETLLQYMSKFPNGRYFAEASDKVQHMDDVEFWYSATNVNTIEAYEKYMKDYPDGYYISQANQAIKMIKDKTYWDTAIAQDTKEAYNEYLESSPLKAYQKEANARIAELEHLENVSADQARWEAIKDSKDPQDYYRYIHDDVPYKDADNLKKADFNYNLYKAKDLYELQGDPQVILSYLNAAKLSGVLPPEFAAIYDEINENILYDKFVSDPVRANADAYLDLYSVRAAEINHKMCMLIADSMTLSSPLEKVRDEAMNYAKNQKDIDYVEDKYEDYKKRESKMNKKLAKQAAAEAKKAAAVKSSSASSSYSTPYSSSSTKSSSISKASSTKTSSDKEPLHMILGLEGAWTSDEEHLMLTPLLSIGGHSNRLNLEFGYTFNVGYVAEEEVGFLDPTVVVRPRWNIVKEKYNGASGSKRKAKDYSNFYMYVAPEVQLDPVKLSNKDYTSMMCDYGARFGIGMSPFDIFVGYSMNRQVSYFGITLYLSRK